MGRDHNCKKKVVRKPESKFDGNKKGTNYLEKEARYLTKNYTNERIRKQIENDNCLFFFHILMLVIALLLIFVVGGEGGRVFGITIIVIALIIMTISGTFHMPKHIHPSCSGRRYTPQEIDAMANDPETVWNETIRAFVTPTTLIGINKGITVVDYDDIADLKSRAIWHTDRATTIDSDARRFGKVSPSDLWKPYYKRQLEWYTYIIVVKTHSGKRMWLTETVYENACDVLKEIVDKKRGGIPPEAASESEETLEE